MFLQAFLLLLLMSGEANFEITIEENGMAHVRQSMVASPQDGLVVVTIPFSVVEGSLSSYIDGFPVSGEMRNLSDLIIVEYQWAQEEEVSILLDYYVYDITGKEKETWFLELPSLEGSLTIRLPESASVEYLVYEGDFPAIRQEENGIILLWENMVHPLTVYYTLKTGSKGYANYMYTLAIPVILAAFLFFYFKKARGKRKVNPSILSILDERERGIVRFLEEHGKSKQAKISRATGIPKTTLSKIMARLAERGIVQMEKDGNVTFCWLKKEIFR